MPRWLFQPGTSRKVEFLPHSSSRLVCSAGVCVPSLARGAACQANSCSRRVARIGDILGQIPQGRSMEVVWDESSLSHSLKATEIP